MADHLENLVAVPEIDLEATLDGYDDPVVFGVGLDAAIYAIARKQQAVRSSPAEYIVVRCQADKISSVAIAGEKLVGSFVQPHPEGVLLVGARCGHTAEGFATNAVLIDWQGRITRRMTLGDGIADVRVTPNGTIWVSYFDEGVLGIDGHDEPGCDPIGAPGLVAFSPRGDVVHRYRPLDAKTDDIFDAYALNVASNDDIWIYFYVDFPIVNLRNGAYRVWDCEVAGARALAIAGDRALLLGDYGDLDLVHVLELGVSRRARYARCCRLVDDRGESLGNARCFGVGPNLYAFSGRRVLVVRDW